MTRVACFLAIILALLFEKLMNFLGKGGETCRLSRLDLKR